MIALIDYGAGNLTSVRKALTALGVDFMTPASPEEFAGAAGLIVPGVGNFAATAALAGPGAMRSTPPSNDGTPLLGICVGMQWLFEGSDEAPEVPGLGVLPGRVQRLQGDPARRLKIPHVGWNALDVTAWLTPPEGLDAGAHVYFTHSYAAPVTADCVGAATHAHGFAAAVERDNVFGVQFHPEKSSDAGLQILQKFPGSSDAHRRSSDGSRRHVMTTPLSSRDWQGHVVSPRPWPRRRRRC